MTAEPDAAAPGRPSPSRRWAAWLAVAVLAAAPARALPHRRSPLAHHRRRRLARRGRVGPQRPQPGAVRGSGASTRGTRCTSRRSSPASNTPSFARVRRRHLAGAAGADDARRGLGRRCSAAASAALGGRRAGTRRRRPARHQLRLRDVGPRRDHGSVDGGVHGRELVGATPRAGPAGLGRCRRRRGARWRSSPRRRRCSSSPRSGSTALVADRAARPRPRDRAPRSGPRGRWPASPSPACSRSRSSSLPNWTDYRFYNWQMSVTRKPSYDLRSLLNRVTWFPILHDIFTRMWFIVVVGLAAFVARVLAWSGGRRPSGCSCSGSASARSSCSCTTSATSAASSSSFPRSSRSPRSCSPAIAPPAGRRSRRCAAGSASSRPAGALRRLRRRRVARPAGLPLRGAARRPAGRGAGRSSATVAGLDRHLAAAAGDAGPPAVDARAPRWSLVVVVAAGSSRSSFSGPPAAPTRTIEASVELGRCCRRARWCTASSPTAWRSRTASGRSSSAAGSATTTDRKQRDDVRYILTYVAPQTRLREARSSSDVLDGLSRTSHHHGRSTSRKPRPATTARRSSTKSGGRPARQARREPGVRRRLTSAPSRRTPTCASAPSTTTRCSSTTAAPRSSRFSSAPASPSRGRVLDAGCGGGGMPLSLAEEARSVVGIDPVDRFQRRRRPARPRARPAQPALRAGRRHGLPFRDGSFDLVLSHAVIEHVADAPLYLRECARVLAPRRAVYLSTAPYLSFAGAHLPRLKVPVPLHLIVGPPRRVRARSGCSRGTRRGRCKEPAHENSFIKAARRGEVKHDDLLEKVRVPRLRGQIAARRAARSSARSCT